MPDSPIPLTTKQKEVLTAYIMLGSLWCKDPLNPWVRTTLKTDQFPQMLPIQFLNLFLYSIKHNHYRSSMRGILNEFGEWFEQEYSCRHVGEKFERAITDGLIHWGHVYIKDTYSTPQFLERCINDIL